MRKLFLMMVAASLVFAGCEKTPTTKPVVKEDSIVLNPSTQTLDSEGGTIHVGVATTGTETWTLTGESEWAVPSVREGGNADFVEFEVAPNTAESNVSATFTFTCGEAEAEFKITVRGTVASSVEFFLVDPETGAVTVERTEGRLEIVVGGNVPYRQIAESVNIVSGDAGWLTFLGTVENDEGNAVVVLEYAENASFENREAQVIIASDETDDPAQTLTVNVTQKQTDRIDIDGRNFEVGLAGGDFSITILANVPFKYELGENDWLTLKSNENNVLTFTAVAAPSPIERRETTITVSAEDPESTLAPVTTSITQKVPGIIRNAAYMKGNQVPGKWTNPTPLTSLSEFTLEALIYSDNFSKTIATSGSASPVNVVMGIEAWFLIRIGDQGYPGDQLQIVYKPSANGVSGSEYKIGTGTNSALKLTASQWHHIAVTFSKTAGTIKAYIDGVDTGVAVSPAITSSAMSAVNFGGRPWVASETDYNRAFWINRAYDDTRYLDGMFSEVRIWNKALTVEEINAENHFYKIDNPETNANLVGYWKFNEGTGQTVTDHSASGNDLPADYPIEWRPVSVP